MSDRLQCKAIPLPSPDQCNDAITDDLQDHLHIMGSDGVDIFSFWNSYGLTGSKRSAFKLFIVKF